MTNKQGKWFYVARAKKFNRFRDAGQTVEEANASATQEMINDQKSRRGMGLKHTLPKSKPNKYTQAKIDARQIKIDKRIRYVADKIERERLTIDHDMDFLKFASECGVKMQRMANFEPNWCRPRFHNGSPRMDFDPHWVDVKTRPMWTSKLGYRINPNCQVGVQFMVEEFYGSRL